MHDAKDMYIQTLNIAQTNIYKHFTYVKYNRNKFYVNF